MATVFVPRLARGVLGSANDLNGAGLTLFPNSLPLSLWLRDFTAAPWLGTPSDTTNADGIPHASAVASVNVSIPSLANYPTAGTALNGHAVAAFNGTNTHMSTDANMDTILDITSGSGWVLFKASAADATEGAGHEDINAQFFAETNGVLGLSYSDQGVSLWKVTNAGHKEVTPIAATTGSYHLAQWKIDGTTLRLRVDSSAWSTKAVTGVDFALGGIVHFGHDYLHTHRYTGDMAEVAISHTVFTDAQFDSVKAYINDRYNLSL